MIKLTSVTLALRALSTILALIEIGLNAYIVSYADDYFYEDPYGDWGVNHDTPSRIAFLLFVSGWTLVMLVYLFLAPVYLITGGQSTRETSRNIKHRYAILVVDLLTTLFWLAGWIALAKLIGGPTSCATFCAAVQASVAFAAGLWATFGINSMIDAWQLWRRRRDSKPDTIDIA